MILLFFSSKFRLEELRGLGIFSPMIHDYHITTVMIFKKRLLGEIVMEMEIEISSDSKSSSSIRNAVSSVILSPPKVYLSSWLLQTFKPVKWDYPRSRGLLPPKLQPLLTTQLFGLIFTNYLMFTNDQLPSLSKSFKNVKVEAEFSYNFHTNFGLHILHRSSILGSDVEIRMFRLGFGKRTSKERPNFEGREKKSKATNYEVYQSTVP